MRRRNALGSVSLRTGIRKPSAVSLNVPATTWRRFNQWGGKLHAEFEKSWANKARLICGRARLGLRGEVRDFYADQPNFNVAV